MNYFPSLLTTWLLSRKFPFPALRHFFFSFRSFYHIPFSSLFLSQHSNIFPSPPVHFTIFLSMLFSAFSNPPIYVPFPFLFFASPSFLPLTMSSFPPVILEFLFYPLFLLLLLSLLLSSLLSSVPVSLSSHCCVFIVFSGSVSSSILPLILFFTIILFSAHHPVIFSPSLFPSTCYFSFLPFSQSPILVFYFLFIVSHKRPLCLLSSLFFFFFH